ncbi:MAG: DNA polymerase III subunit beta [Chloroflexi bacterium]|nr:DNA polymerase III subunit beta [Chloroflexota bacterium]
MRLACLQENLKRGLALAGHAVAGRSSLPVLANILLATESGRLKLAGNNLEIGITALVGAKVDEDGAITIPAKLLSDLVGNLPNDTVELEVDPRTKTLTVTCRGTKASIKGLEADEFPAMLTFGNEPVLAYIPPELLRKVVGQVVVAAAAENTNPNPILQGVLIRLSGTQATFAAIDGYRLAVRTIELPEPVAHDAELVIPSKAMAELGRTLGDSETPIAMSITPNGGQVIFHSDTVDFVSRVIDGKFPDYERFVPPASNTSTRSVISTAEFSRAVKRIALFSQAAGNIVTLTMERGDGSEPGRLLLNANAAEIGESVEAISALIDGDDGKLALNVRYLQEALGAIDTDQVALETQTPNSPGVFRPIGGDEYLHLVMPMRIP